MTAPTLPKGGIAQLVQNALQYPIAQIPLGEALKWSIQERACWIMGFERAMQMVDDYIKKGLPNYMQQGEAADKIAAILNAKAAEANRGR